MIKYEHTNWEIAGNWQIRGDGHGGCVHPPSQQNQQGESNPQRKIVCRRGDGWQNLKGDYTADWPQDDSIQICKDYIPLMVFQVRKAMKENECPLSPEIAQIAVGLSLPRLMEPLR
ncbi:hypothetical protein CEXT_425761 [Caerostris extrusa]|uniref:Uncharacterized protein n=1 Tax=Caerostris extrusa TaxID=172846 RepID=A0AAV4XXW6_CAEEX|nr:hypothetical protein CEXT_425761 [Caerostris extrusa]